MKTEVMIYDRSARAFQVLFPKAVFEGYENSFGRKIWFSMSASITNSRIERICKENKIKILVVTKNN